MATVNMVVVTTLLNHVEDETLEIYDAVSEPGLIGTDIKVYRLGGENHAEFYQKVDRLVALLDHLEKVEDKQTNY